MGKMMVGWTKPNKEVSMKELESSLTKKMEQIGKPLKENDRLDINIIKIKTIIKNTGDLGV